MRTAEELMHRWLDLVRRVFARATSRIGRAHPCRERRVTGIADAVKGALPALSAAKAPFAARAML